MPDSAAPIMDCPSAALVPAVDPFTYSGPHDADPDEGRIFATANGYVWSYLDTCRGNGSAARPVPDGWAFAYLEHHRRAGQHRMAIREAFRLWRATGALPGLPNPDVPARKGDA